MVLKLNDHGISTDSPLLNMLIKSGWNFEVVSEAGEVYDLMILYDPNGNDWYKRDFMDIFDIPVTIKQEQVIKRDENGEENKMTNKEAIEYIETILYDERNTFKMVEALNMAIEALSADGVEVVKRDENGKPISGRYIKVKDSDWDEPDNVNHPQHYEGKTSLECIDTMRLIFGDEHLSWFCLMNAYKYLWRHKNKNGIEDLEKAEWYLDYAAWHPVDGVPDPVDSDIYDILKEMLRTAKMDYERPID